MTLLPVSDYLGDNAALCDAVVRLRGPALVAELGRIASAVMASPHGQFLPAGSMDAAASSAIFPSDTPALLQEISFDGHCFGHYSVAGRSLYNDADRRHLASLASLTAGVLQVHSLAQRSTHAFAQVEALLAQQTQILDQLHESVLTMDLTGYITSWNKGAERLFGYTSVEAVGRNILFLYDDEDTGFHDAFLEQGGRLMEVRRRKKSGEIFWASLSLSPLQDMDDKPIGLIAYLTDITERKLAEADLRELHRELDQRVIDRTAELLRANQHLQLEVQQRERAQEALRDAERFFHATIDSLTDRVLVLDQAGSLVHANQACLAFVGQTPRPLQYLEFCETDPRWQRSAGRELSAGIRAVIAGTADTFALEYEFATRSGPRWSQARISRFLGEGPLRVVVAHTDITERKLMDGALRQSHAQLRQLALHVETAKEDERKRISRDIHDELGQNLLALRIDISMLSARTEGSHPRLHRRVGAVLSNVDTTIKSVRGIMNELRPMALDLGLQAAIEWQVGDFRKRSGVACRLLIRDEALFAAIGSQVEIVLFRIVQEALSNVMRHAQASQAEIELSSDACAVYVVISDNGIGITPLQQRKKQCFGLIGIAERVTALGGHFEVGLPASGAGCRLSLQIPLPGAGRPAA